MMLLGGDRLAAARDGGAARGRPDARVRPIGHSAPLHEGGVGMFPVLTIGPFAVSTHDVFSLLGIAVVDAYWIFVLGQRLPTG